MNSKHVKRIMFSHFALIIFVTLTSCKTTSDNIDLTDILLNSTQSDVNEVTNQLLSGKKLIKSEWLRDKRDFPTDIILLCHDDSGKLFQLGVEKISDYFLCVLEIKYKIYSEHILREIIPDYSHQCSPTERCEVCHSLTFQLDPAIRNHLIEYWTHFLDSK